VKTLRETVTALQAENNTLKDKNLELEVAQLG
jgi:hypothetical protein